MTHEEALRDQRRKLEEAAERMKGRGAAPQHSMPPQQRQRLPDYAPPHGRPGLPGLGAAVLPSRSHYAALGVAVSASRDDIRKAYKRLALQYHPDKQNGTELERVHVSDSALRCFLPPIRLAHPVAAMVALIAPQSP